MLPPNASNPSNPSNPSKRAKPALAAAKLSQVVPFLVPNCCCQTSGCEKLAAVASQVFLFLLARSIRQTLQNPSSPSRRAKPALGAATLEAVAMPSSSFSGEKLAAVASQVFLFLLARNCRMLPPNASNPSNPSNPSKCAKPALGAAKLISQVVPFLVPNCCC